MSDNENYNVRKYWSLGEVSCLLSLCLERGDFYTPFDCVGRSTDGLGTDVIVRSREPLGLVEWSTVNLFH